MRIQASLACLFLTGVLGSALAGAQGPAPEAVANWPAPAYWSPPEQTGSVPEREGGVRTQAVEALPTSPMPFVAITPCRVADTRGNGFTGAYGPPALAGGGAARVFNIPAGPCPGIPASAGAYSINVAAILPASDGFMTVCPTGSPQPTSSDLNFLGGEVIANAIVAPAGTGGAIVVFVNVSTHMILDINGYYAPSGVGTGNTFLGSEAGNFTMTGSGNTGIGASAFQFNTTGSNNTATGVAALARNTTGQFNTATGSGALFPNTTGSDNTAVGSQALGSTTGNRNTALGSGAAASSTTSDNTAIGYRALVSSSGGGNIALGSNAGVNLTGGGFNMYLGNEGVAIESTTIRIGSGAQHTRLFVAGVLGSPIFGAPVLISGLGQLGVSSSSARFKEDVRDMGEASDRLMRLRPVSFRYKGRASDPVQFGLIAEEVEKVLPELVLRNAVGEVETVLYNELPAMLLNELQRQQKRIVQQSESIDHQAHEIDALKRQLATIEARLPADRAP